MNEKIEKVLEKVQKAPRYTGGEMNTEVKQWDECPLHFGFCFPDTYEVGMSHLGLKILYGLINRESWSLCERFFMPWTDMMALMEEEQLPLLSMESRHPLNAFDVVGFTLQYEMSFSNILAMLKMGGIPLEGKDRGEEDPIVVAGGPCAFNPEPLADFIDAFMIGDGEDVMTELNRVILDRKEKGLSREQCLKNLAKLEGVYVPSLYNVAYNEDGTVLRDAELPGSAGFREEARGRGPEQHLLSGGVPRALHGGDFRPDHAGDHARLHPRLPFLPGRHPVPPGPGAQHGKADRPGGKTAAVYGI